MCAHCADMTLLSPHGIARVGDMASFKDIYQTSRLDLWEAGDFELFDLNLRNVVLSWRLLTKIIAFQFSAPPAAAATA